MAWERELTILFNMAVTHSDTVTSSISEHQKSEKTKSKISSQIFFTVYHCVIRVLH